MSNPWHSVPLEEYELHMSAETVQQLEPLAETFSWVLQRVRPASVAILGVAGGNGLDRVEWRDTHRVLGIDFQPEYLVQVKKRFPQCETLTHDLTQPLPPLPGFDLVHAALVFEHTGLGTPVANAHQLVLPGGVLAVVLQLPSATTRGVSPGKFASIQQLGEVFRYVDPEEIVLDLTNRGMVLWEESRTPLPAGKGLWLGLFRKSPLGE